MIESLSQHPLVDALAWTLIHSLWQGIIILVVFAAVLRMLRAASPKNRYRVSLLGFCLLPLLSIVTFYEQLQPAEVELIPRTALVDSGDVSEAQAFFILGHLQSPNPAEESNEFIDDKLRIALVLCWFAGALLFSIRLGAGFIGVYRLTRIGVSPVDQKLQNLFVDLVSRVNISLQPRLLISSRIDVPVAVGWIKPCILLPASIACGYPSAVVEAYLLHELVHVRRYDYLVNLMQHVVETLLFFIPRYGGYQIRFVSNANAAVMIEPLRFWEVK